MKQHLKAALVILVIGIIGILSFRYFMNSRNSDDSSANYSLLESLEKEGASNFSAKDVNGTAFELESFKDKIVILNFWASWCSPCVEEIPSLIKLVKEFKGKVQLVAISGDNSLEDIQVFLKSFPELKDPDIKIVWDHDRKLMQQFGISRLPESLILKGDFKLAKKIVGTINWYTKDSIEYINTLIH